jgi:hypothetical protein
MTKQTAVKLTPTDEHAVPYDTQEEKPATFLEELVVAGDTASLLEELGAPPEVDESEYEKEKLFIEEAIAKQDPKLLKSYPTALGAAAFVKAYGASLAHDVVQIRTALTNKLLEIADCGDTKFELKAIELLGKHSDISLFTERSEINISYNSPEALERAILERVGRLIHATQTDAPSLGIDLEEELGMLADFTEVTEEDETDEAEPEADEDE